MISRNTLLLLLSIETGRLSADIWFYWWWLRIVFIDFYRLLSFLRRKASWLDPVLYCFTFPISFSTRSVRGAFGDQIKPITSVKPQFPSTSVMAFPQILEPLQCKIVFNRYLAIGRSNKKKIKKQGGFVFEFCFWEDPPHPVNWSPTHSTGPQTHFLQISRYRSLRFQKTRCIFSHKKTLKPLVKINCFRK